MRTVVWRRLVLHGFGRFQGSVSLDLCPGINVWAAPNESGKSTVLAGLAAVLFGLPTGGGPADFGRGRWRNWSAPPRFAGELELEAGGCLYRIERDFASHRVHVAQGAPGAWQPVMHGEHNPGARKRNARYEEFLLSKIGIASRELFMSTFVLGQPLPEPDGLDERVQQLVSGAGAAAYQEALNYLVTGVRTLTRFSRELGVTDRNAQKAGRLEELDERIAALEREIDASRAVADSLESLQSELHALEGREAEARRRLEAAEAALNAWSHWRTLLGRRRTLLDRQVQLDHALETVRKLEAAQEERERALAAGYPELVRHEKDGAGHSDVGSRLVRLQQLEERIRTGREAIAREIAGVKQRAAELAREWAEFQAQKARLAAVEAEMEDYRVFAAAGPTLRERLASYHAHRLQLERELDEARKELARWREPRERYAAQQAEFARAFGDLAAWADGAADIVEAQVTFLKQRDEAAERLRGVQALLETARRRFRTRVAVACSAGLALAGVLGYVVHRSLGLGGVLGILAVVLALLGVFFRRLGTPVRELAAKARAAAEEFENLDTRAAADQRLAGMGPAELGALRQRLLARDEAAAALEGMRVALPAEDEERLLLARVRRAEDELRAFLAETEPARALFGDGIEDAYRRWLRLTHEAEGLRERISAFAGRHTGLAGEKPEDVPAAVLPGIWGVLAGLLAASGRTVATLGDVAAHVTVLPEEFWEEARAAREREEPLASAIAEAAELRSQLAAVLAAAGGDAGLALSRWEAWRAAREAIERLSRERAGVLAAHGAASVTDLKERLADVGNQAAALWQQLEQWSAAHPGLPHPDEAADGEALEARLRQLQEDRDRWRAEADKAAATRRGLLEEQARLAGARVRNIAQGEEELAALRRERSRLSLEVQAMARAHRELAAAVEEYQATHRSRLAGAATRYFQRATGVPRRVDLDESFAVTVIEPDGRACAVSQLSQGTQDQLYLALRLAVADLVAGDAPLPLMLDDPFVNCDAVRLERIRAALTEVARERQVVLFTHRSDLAQWGRAVRAVEGGGPAAGTGI